MLMLSWGCQNLSVKVQTDDKSSESRPHRGAESDFYSASCTRLCILMFSITVCVIYICVFIRLRSSTTGQAVWGICAAAPVVPSVPVTPQIFGVDVSEVDQWLLNRYPYPLLVLSWRRGWHLCRAAAGTVHHLHILHACAVALELACMLCT